MSLPRWDDEMKFELFRLKSELRPENFRVLAPPLGIGHMKPEGQTSVSKALYPALAAAPLPQSTISPSPGQVPPVASATMTLTPVHEIMQAPDEVASSGPMHTSYAGGARSQYCSYLN